MTCKDCIYWKACKDSAYDYYGDDAASAYDEDSCCKAFAETCENFSDKSEWVHLSGKDSATAYHSAGSDNSTTADYIASGVTITASKPKKKVTKTTGWLTANYSEEDLQKIKELAMKECEEAGGMTCKDCIHQNACLDWCRGFGEEAALCEHFTNKYEFVHLPYKYGERVFSIIVIGGVPTVMADRVFGFIIVGDTVEVITNWYSDGGEWGYNIFPTQEEAQKEIDRRKN